MSNKNIGTNQDLKTRLETICRDLVFVSEIDSEVTPFFGKQATSLKNLHNKKNGTANGRSTTHPDSALLNYCSLPNFRN